MIGLAAVLIIFAAVFCPAPANAQSDDMDPLSFMSSHLWRGVNDIVPDEDVLFVIYKSGLAVVRPLDAFTRIDTLALLPLDHQYQDGLVLEDELLLYSIDGRVAFVSISERANPRLTAELELESDFIDLAVVNSFIFVARGFDGTDVYDISDRSEAIMIGNLLDAAHTVAVERCGQYLYVVDDYNGIFVYEVTDTEISLRVKKLFEKQLMDVACMDTIAYGANNEGGTVILDISDPVAPQVVRTYETPTYVTAVSAQDGYIFASDVYGNAEVYHPDSSQMIAYIENALITKSPELYEDIYGKFLVSVDSGGACVVFRTDDDWGIKHILRFGGGAQFAKFGVVDDVVYVANDPEKVKLLRVRPDGRFIELEPLSVYAADLDRLDNWMITADTMNGLLQVHDIVSSSWLQLQVGYDIYWPLFKIEARDEEESRIYVASLGEETTYILGLRLEMPLLFFSTRVFEFEHPQALAFYGDNQFIMAGDGNHGGIFELTDPAMASGIFEWQDSVTQIYLYGDSILTAGSSGLNVYAIENNMALATGEELLIDGGINQFVIDRTNLPVKLYCAAGENGIYVIDEESFSLLQHIQTPGYAEHVDRVDSLLVVSDRNGVLVYKINTALVDEPVPEGSVNIPDQIVKNYPNPFNQSTRIDLDLSEIESTSHLEIDIYNGLGRRVRTLIHENVIPGQYSFEWDGRDDNGSELASGLYFCRIKAGAEEFSLKMLLLK